MKILIKIFFCLLSMLSPAQTKYRNSFKLTAGRILFGTGDVVGYAVNVEYSKPISSHKRLSKHFSLGTELSFENGSKQPKVINPTLSEFFSETYNTTTNIVLTPKITYCPFNKTFLNGINITGGVSLGYTSQNFELQSAYRYDTVLQQSVRRSYLEYINEVIFGYRVTAGYEWPFKIFLIGARLDLDSYSNGDINTFLGLKAGIRF